MKIILIIFLFISCEKQKTEKIKADLTFRSISFSSFYGASDERYEKLVKELDSTVKNSDEMNGEIELYHYLTKVKNHNLLRSPYIYLNIEKDSVITVYLKESEYEKVKHFKQVDLFKENNKVELELELIEKEKGIYYSDKIIKINKVNGRSRSNI